MTGKRAVRARGFQRPPYDPRRLFRHLLLQVEVEVVSIRVVKMKATAEKVVVVVDMVVVDMVVMVD